MRKRIFLYGCIFLILIFQVKGWAASSPGIRISGAVKQPIHLTLEDLSKFQSISVRLNEVDSKKNFLGAFNYQGVPLRTILELAYIQKEEASFFKFLDMAIVVRNKEGNQIVLSWGEVFYRNPAEIIIAFSSSPMMPHLAEGIEKWQNTLSRPIGFPKLVVANDFYIDRCIEEITAIEVIDLNPKLKPEKIADPYPSSFSIFGAIKNLLLISDLTAYACTEDMIKVVGSGKGYQGLQQISGVPLVKLLEKAGAQMDVNTVYLVTHSDGYCAILSFGELFLDPAGGRILIADGNDKQGIGKEGRFTLFIPHDLSSDRNVKGIESIEVINLNKFPKVYIIGVGCADTSLLTMEAINYLNKADVVVCSEDIAKRYAYYIDYRPVLFDPFKLLKHKHLHGEEQAKLSQEERKKLREEKVTEAVQMIRGVLDQGKSVALLEYGDPSIYGSFNDLTARFADHEKTCIPGISAFNAANALIGKEMGCKGSIILSSPWSLKDNPAMLAAIASKGDTLAIFMGLEEVQDLILFLKNYYQGSTPITFAIQSGYSNSQRLIKTTLDKAVEAAEKENEEKESWLGMIYVGPCLE